MSSNAPGWLTPEGEPRFEIRETLDRENGFVRYRALDRVLGRPVLLTIGDEALAARAARVGRLEHPAVATVYTTGRTPEGRTFLATLDHTEAVPLSDLLGDLTREEVLSVVVTVAHAASHAQERGIMHADLDLESVLRFPDGQFRVLGWEDPPAGDASPIRAVQKLLRRAIVPYGPAPRPLWSIVRHEYEGTTDLARDLTDYLGGRAHLRATDLPWHRKVAAWALYHPGLATLLGGSAAVGLLLAALAAGVALLARSREEQTREIEAEARAGRLEAQLGRAADHLGQVRELQKKRLQYLGERRKVYHSVEALRPNREEMVLDAEIANATSHWTAEARLARTALELATVEDEKEPSPEAEARIEEIQRDLEVSRVEFLFAQAAFEEEKTLSTRTLERARATAPLASALAARDAAAARGALEALRAWPDHPYLRAAEALVGVIERRPAWLEAFDALVARLEAKGGLAVVGAPGDSQIWLSEITNDEHGCWKEAESKELQAGQPYSLPMGDYLVEIYREGKPCRFEVLVERGEREEVDASQVPASVPEGWVWVPPAVFYRGGSEEGVSYPARYRKVRVERPLLVRATEVSFEEYMTWIKTLRVADEKLVDLCPGQILLGTYFLENWQPNWPIQGVTRSSAESYAETASPQGWKARLPTEEEWELAARGVAGRLYPWGDRYVEGRCHSVPRQGEPSSSPVPVEQSMKLGDVSIFKISGLAGNVAEWTSTEFDETLVIAKGGGYDIGEMEAAPSRFPTRPVWEYTYGIRLVAGKR